MARLMKITSFSIHSVMLLIETAKRNSELFTIREFSVEQQIPVNTIRPMVHFLCTNGYLVTIQGKGGGFKLRNSICEINIGKLLRLTESRFAVTKSISANKSKEICNVNDIIEEAFAAMFAVFEKYTLSDLSSPLFLIFVDISTIPVWGLIMKSSV